MILLLHGNDFEKTREKLHSLLKSLLLKKPDAEVFRIDDENFESSRLQELCQSQGLFENKYIVVLDRVFRNAEAKEEVLEKLTELKTSENIFIIVEESLNKATLSKIEKKAEKVQEISEAKKSAEEKKFSIFTLTDALGKRDRKNLWVLYQKALANGSEPEEIHGILFWQVKSMLLANSSKDAKEAGLNPFVYKKSVAFSRNYSEDELKKLSSGLVDVYHNSRRGIVDFGIALERFVLKI